MAINFERSRLYEEVWAMPLTQLAKKYSLSDNGLRKVCKALAIPLPARGHWAKVAAGQTVSRSSLPLHSGPTEFISRRTRAPTATKAFAANPWLSEWLRYESAEENRIDVGQDLGSSHPLILKGGLAIDRALKTLEHSRKLHEEPRKTTIGKWQPNWDRLKHPQWSNYLQSGKILDSSDCCLPLFVSIPMVPRALLILDALLKAAEKRGIPYKCGPGRLRFELQGVEILVRITEQVERILLTKAENKHADFYRQYKRLPTGVLRLHVSSGTTEVKFLDAKNVPLEGQLNAVYCRVYKSCVKAVEAKVILAESHRQRIIDDARREVDEKERAIQREYLRLEEIRKQKLILQASSWGQAVLLRDFVKHVSEAGSAAGLDTTSLSKWRDWATKIADKIDPSSSCVDDIDRGAI